MPARCPRCGRGVSFGASFVARLLRDAGCNLLLIMAGLGEAIGARVLVLMGARGRGAVTATALDTLAEAVAQLPFIALAFAVLPRFWGLMRLPSLPAGGGDRGGGGRTGAGGRGGVVGAPPW